MSTMMSGILEFPNDSKEQKLVDAATNFPGDSESEVDFVVCNGNLKSDLIGQTKSPDTFLCSEALGSERSGKIPSLQIASDIENNDYDEKLEKATVEDSCCSDSDENEIIINCRINKDSEDEIDQLTDKLRSYVMKTLLDLESRPDATEHGNFKNPKNSNHEYGETRVLHDETLRLEKALKLKISMTLEHNRSISSNSSSRYSSYEDKKSILWESAYSSFGSGTSEATMEIGTPQNDLGQSNLPLPPRLKEATYRNPLRLSSGRRDSTWLPASGSLGQLFSPKESSGQNSVQSALSKAVKKQKDISVKLWSRSLDLIRELGNLEFLTHPCCRPEHGNLDLQRHPDRRPVAHGDPDCRSVKWLQSLHKFKLRSKSVKIMGSRRLSCTSPRTLSRR